jgi:hypothetical protein
MKTLCRCIAVAAMTCAALPAAAQHGSPADDAWRAEAAGIVARLERLEAGLLQDPELRRMDQALGAELMDGMLRADPGLPRDAERLPRLQAERDGARERGDTIAFRRLRGELAEIQSRWKQAQAAALADPELAAKVRVFNALLRERMRASSPAAARLLDRLQVIEEHMAGRDAVPR